MKAHECQRLKDHPRLEKIKEPQQLIAAWVPGLELEKEDIIGYHSKIKIQIYNVIMSLFNVDSFTMVMKAYSYSWEIPTEVFRRGERGDIAQW